MSVTDPQRITLIGLGTIGMSMAALHLSRENVTVDVFDTRPDFDQYLFNTLPNFLDQGPSSANFKSQPSTSAVASLIASGRLNVHTSLETACASATIVQEQGPENLEFKQTLWAQVESFAPSSAHLWTSTSGIAASAQQQKINDKSRLLVVHPFNPPHIMPLLEIVPSPDTSPERLEFAREYFSVPGSKHRPVVLQKEIPGFVGNRLAFALLREACYLVQEDVVSAKDLDTIMKLVLGQGGTMQAVWDNLGKVNVLRNEETSWKEKVVSQVNEAYGTLTPGQVREKEERLKDFVAIQTKKYGHDVPEA
ncbi:putative 3-hydroxyacyl-CoA dehyrogenase [Aspergillus arachidicola]|uniref:Putative 3-hydroxyacyl-CoA dehyrogenase n=1 Tax=Aspergillus arachidicola TaxID=656916 RepID=A0A2G7FMI9_9EURO|nr:putative 3-hydroxyacyl-CoA dehyrogenase [Aspergillus arachidicola]